MKGEPASEQRLPGVEPGLTRRLGAGDGIWLVVSTMIGVGIFTTPGIVASMVSGPWVFGGLWLLGGMLSLMGALAYAELAAAYPRSGGEYVYLREAFGPLAGFLSGWTSFMAGFSGAIAAGAMGFAVYLDRLVPGAGSTSPLLDGALGPASRMLTPRTLVALAVVAVFTWIHGRGLDGGRRLQNALGAAGVLTIVCLVTAGLAFLPTFPVPGTTAPLEGAPASRPWIALVLIMFTYSGWNAATYVAGEMKRPGIEVRRAVAAGTLLVMALYLGLNLVYIRSLTFVGLRSTLAAADGAAAVLFGAWAADLVALLVLLALLGSVSAMILTGPRIYYAMARDGALPAHFAAVDPGRGVPTFSILAQSGWCALLILTGTFEAILTYTGFAVVLFGTAAVGSLFVLRRRTVGPRRPWGYPVTPALFVAVGLLMVLQSIRHAPVPSLMGVGVIVAGVPLHLHRLHTSRTFSTSGTRPHGRII